MPDEFFWRALLAGFGVALVAGPLGCFVVWRGMAYFGATMSHGALLGVALAFLAGLDPIIGVFVVGAAMAPFLLMLERRVRVARDTLLGIMAHGALALGLVLIALMTWLPIDLTAYLFGDILAVSRTDVAVIIGAGAALLGVLAAIWRPLLAGTVSEELASAEGMQPGRALLIYMMAIAALIAIAMKIVGVLLIVSLLIIPPAIARRFARSPEAMAAIASLAGMLAVALGLTGSLAFDTPSGPSIVIAGLMLFLATLVPRIGASAERRERPT